MLILPFHSDYWFLGFLRHNSRIFAALIILGAALAKIGVGKNCNASNIIMAQKIIAGALPLAVAFMLFGMITFAESSNFFSNFQQKLYNLFYCIYNECTACLIMFSDEWWQYLGCDESSGPSSSRNRYSILILSRTCSCEYRITLCRSVLCGFQLHLIAYVTGLYRGYVLVLHRLRGTTTKKRAFSKCTE